MRIKGTDIYMTRGDTENLYVSCVDEDNVPIDFVAGDTVYLTIKKSTRTETVELQKVVTEFEDGGALIEFAPEDMKLFSFGSYVYDIQLTQADGTVTTIVKPSKFVIEDEVTDD
ncbi:MAG TPA: hypothetical protein VFC74_00305 [Oscillospiraceae bacterium]|nr:hypothetical protein [Oscillospiraceae bacterium]